MTEEERNKLTRLQEEKALAERLFLDAVNDHQEISVIEQRGKAVREAQNALMIFIAERLAETHP